MKYTLPSVWGVIVGLNVHHVVNAQEKEKYDTLELTTVLATGEEENLGDVVSQVSVWDGAQQHQKGAIDLQGLLSRSPGVFANQAGQRGAQTSLFTRGTESDHTSVYIDGVKVSDARVFPFDSGNLLSSGVMLPNQRLELLRGSQSALYGSDAIGGVLALSMRRGRGEPEQRLWAERGAFDSFRGGAEASGELGELSYHFFGSYETTDNARPQSDFDSTQFGVRLDYQLNEDTVLGVSHRTMRSDILSPPVGFFDLTRGVSDNEITSLWLESNINDLWSTELRFGYYRSDYRSSLTSFPTTVNTDRSSVSSKNRLKWSEGVSTTVGMGYTWLDTKNSGADARLSDENYDLYFQHEHQIVEGFDLLLGGRYDEYEANEDSFTWRAGFNVEAAKPEWSFHGSIGSGFKRPSITDLHGFGGFGGNLDLENESSISFDGGVRYETETLRADITYFESKVKSLISGFPAQNIDEAKMSGVEFSLQRSFAEEKGALALSYTYLDARDQGTHKRLVRRPGHVLALDVNIELTDELLVGVGYQVVSKNRDVGAYDIGTSNIARLYTRYQLTEQLAFNARIENLFNEHYEHQRDQEGAPFGTFVGFEHQW